MNIYHEQPQWTLMVTHNGQIVRVRQEHADEKLTCGWIIIARESDLLPFNPPRLVADPESEDQA